MLREIGIHLRIYNIKFCWRLGLDNAKLMHIYNGYRGCAKYV